jgi:hypothetical protein
MNGRDLVAHMWVCGWMCLGASMNAAVKCKVLTSVKNHAECWQSL